MAAPTSTSPPTSSKPNVNSSSWLATGGHQAALEHDTAALAASAEAGRALNPGQVELVTTMAVSGARVQLAIAPAGAGKTTAMQTLAAAWALDGGDVLGLAPSAAAAAQLRDQTGTTTETLAKLAWSITHDDLPAGHVRSAADAAGDR